MRRKATDYLRSDTPLIYISSKYVECNGLPLKITWRKGVGFEVKDPNLLERVEYHWHLLVRRIKKGLPLWRRLFRWIKRIE